MSVHVIFYQDGAKMMRPVLDRATYMALRDSEQNRKADKHHMVQMNYSCLPSSAGSAPGGQPVCGPLRGSNTPSNSVGMDVDILRNADEDEKDYQARLAAIPELVLSKKEELGLLMLERSATKGYHIAFRRRTELSQEDNLRWASDLLGVEYDKGAKDITRVFFTPADKLIYLDDEIFQVAAAPVAVDVPAESHMPKSAPERTAAADGHQVLPDPSAASLTAFDLCCHQAGLDPERMDVWGAHNWHTNLMAVLSVGVPKLMSYEQLMAVIRKRLANYAAEPDCQNLVSFFYEKYQADKGYMSTVLREINAKAQAQIDSDEEEQKLGEVDLDSMMEGWEQPPLPDKKHLPRIIYLLLKPFPPQYWPMLAFAAVTILGAIASHYRAVYINGKEIAANLYTAIIAGSGQGKSFVTRLFELMTRNTLDAWDCNEWEKVRQNQELRDKMANSKERPARYHPKLRIVETMSKTSMLDLSSNLGGCGMLMANFTEADSLTNLSSAQFSGLSAPLRLAWDGDVTRQYYMSETSCNTRTRLLAAVLLTGTPKSVISRLFSDTENGLMQRFMPLLLAKQKRTFLPPVFTPLSDEEQAELDGLLGKLWQKDLSLGETTLCIDMPKTRKMVTDWYHELEERYNEGLISDAEADLSHRIGQDMQRAALPIVALEETETKEIIGFCRWIGDTAYANICRIFSSRVQQDMAANEELIRKGQDRRRKGESILSRMPETFTIQQFQEERERQGMSGDCRMLLSRYCNSGRITRVARGVYCQKKQDTDSSIASST